MVAPLLILLVGGSFFYCEYLIYFPAILKCAWPKSRSADGRSEGSVVRAMVLSDTHLLGAVGGHWFDKLRRYFPRFNQWPLGLETTTGALVSVSGNGRWREPSRPRCGCSSPK